MKHSHTFTLTLIVLGLGGQDRPCSAKFIENTAVITQISLFDTALVMTNTFKVSIHNEHNKKILLTNKEFKHIELSYLPPPPLLLRSLLLQFFIVKIIRDQKVKKNQFEKTY